MTACSALQLITLVGLQATKIAFSWWGLLIICAGLKSNQCRAWSPIPQSTLLKLAHLARSIGARALRCRKRQARRICSRRRTTTWVRWSASTLRSRSSSVITYGSIKPSCCSSFRGDAQTRTCVIPCKPSKSITVFSTGRLHTFRS